MIRTLVVSLLVAISSYPALAGSVDVTFTGSSGQQDSSGYYISPYSATVNGVNTTIYCDDFANTVTVGENYTANITNLGSGDLSNTRYGSITQTLATQNGGSQAFNGLQLYEMAAWLTMQFTANGASNGDIQDTLWDLFNPNSLDPGVKPPQPSSNTWLYAAEQNYSSINPNNFYILTNVAPVNMSGQVQEFLFTPEPSSLLLLASSLIVFLAWGYRKRLRSVRS